MANPLKGEARIGDSLIRVDFNALCELEGATGKAVPELLAQFDAGLGFTDLRSWIGVLLVDAIPSEAVGELIGSHGYEASLAALAECLAGFFSPKEKEKDGNPRRKARGGTGASSNAPG